MAGMRGIAIVQDGTLESVQYPRTGRRFGSRQEAREIGPFLPHTASDELSQIKDDGESDSSRLFHRLAIGCVT